MAPHSTLDSDYSSGSSTPTSASAAGDGFVDGLNGLNNGRAVDPQEPIAIIGMGCRLPGGSHSSSKLWELLKAGRTAQSRFPPSRFNIDGFYHPNSDRPGSLNMEGGYFIEDDIRGFENSFFGINNLEATYMDPQQRKLLEVVFETFENAGFTLDQVSDANIGCYVGNFVTDFITMQLKDSEYTHRYSATGLGTTILANRISHVFNMKGPSFVIDTACSSSLYCLHAAVAALIAGECDSAIVAGANLIQSPEQQLATMKAGVLSKTSTCHTFDSSADGYGRADGIGAILVKRLSDAIRDGDPIRSVIRGTAINSNGKTNGITLPSADGQEAVIRKAYAQAGLGFNETDYIECHGTGTAVGDPIEVEAVSRVFKKPQGAPLLIGSVKSNLGHSEAASGLSSIIKVAMALEKGEIPPTYGVKNINPKIKTDEWNVQIVTETTPWPKNLPHNAGRLFRRAGVNSFGYGGANAHAILEAPQMHVPVGYNRGSLPASLTRSTLFLPFSGSNTAALERRVTDIAAAIDFENVNIADLAYTLGVKRTHLSTRGYILSGQDTLKDDLKPENLRVALQGKTYSKLPLAFVFTGQGAQWPEMGKELMKEFPSFRRTIQRLDAALQMLPHAPTWTLQGAILEPAKTSMINHASRSQPVCTAVQIALVQLLASWGIKPESVIGHSSGEIAAAYTAGYLTPEQSIIIAYYRGHCVTKSTMVGAMMAAGLGAEDANKKISELDLVGKIRVACVNSPESVTISGDTEGIETLRAQFDQAGTFARVLKTDGKAYHSHHMAVIGQEYEDLLTEALDGDDFPTTSNGVRFISSVTDAVVNHAVGPAYWRANLESPVLFANVVERLIKDTASHLVELGPHSALELPIKQTRTKLNISETKVHYGSALSRGKNSITTILNLVGDLFLHGHDISFKGVNYVDSAFNSPKARKNVKTQEKMLLDLPNYTWDYSGTVFNESRVSVEWRNRKYPRHDLLGSQVHGGNGISTNWRNVVKAKDIPWMEGHKLDTTTVFPAAGYLAMAVEAMCQVADVTKEQEPALSLRNVNITKALTLGSEETDAGVELFTTLYPAQLPGGATDAGWYQFNISSYTNGTATTHANGLVKIDSAPAPLEVNLPIVPSTMEPQAPRTWYGKFAKGGLNFQGQFQSLTEIQNPRKKENPHTLAKTELRQGGGSGPSTESEYLIHPITIDALFQAGIIASTSGVVRELRAKVPVHIEEMHLRAPVGGQKELKVNATSEAVGFGTIRVDGELFDDEGRVFLQINRCRQVSYQSGIQQEAGDERHPMLRVVWKPDVTRLGAGDAKEFSQYIEQYAAKSESKVDDATVRLGAALDLLIHKHPRLRILNLDVNLTEFLVDTLRLETDFKKCKTLVSGSYSEDGTLTFEDLTNEGKTSTAAQVFDVVILGSKAQELEAAKELVDENGSIIVNGSPADADKLQTLGFTTLQAPSDTILAQTPQEITAKQQKTLSKQVLIVERNADHVLNSAIAAQAKKITGLEAKRIPLESVTADIIAAHTRVISTIELENPVLSRVTEDEMKHIKTLTDNCTNLVWVTGGRLFQSASPEHAVVYGLSRALMLEQPSLRFFVVDVDHEGTPVERSAKHVVEVLQQALIEADPDYEFVQNAGLLHVSRFVPEETLNRVFREKQGAEKLALPLKDARPFRLGTDMVGQIDSIFFRREEAKDVQLADGHVEVSVKAVGLNTKDLQAINGDGDNTSGSFCTSQYTAVVANVGTGVENLAVGDRVVVMTPGYFATTESVPAWACQKLADNEDFTTLSSVPLQLSTAIYAVNNRAHVQAGESVLVITGSDIAADQAAIRVAQLAGAEVFAVGESTNLPSERVFTKGDKALVAKLLKATEGRGVDVVLNFANDAAPISSIGNVFADCGRLVHVGKSSLAEAIATDSTLFRKSVTVTTFDIANILSLKTVAGQKIRSQLLADSIALYRQGQLNLASSPKVFDVSEVRDAFRALAAKGHSGSVVVSLENEASLVPTLPLKYDTVLSPEKSYLLVGCLGGLGRSMSKWMLARGARKFVFMGRSGTDRAPARRLVEDLELAGAQVTVVRGDVINMEDVELAVNGIDGPIGGVIQAAMGLDEALFTTMPRDYWLTGLKPKIVGSWNLHNAIRGRDSELDFFLMTSSISGSVGTATESNYCSANYFLDVFARHRHSLGLPATSIGLGMISEVGYLHENPEIEAMLLRKGIQAINEDEMLQIIDASLATPTAVPGSYDELARAHVLTGLEPLGLKELRAKGFEGTSPVLGDPRASLLSAALDESTDAASSNAASGMPAEVAEAIATGASVEDAVLKMISKKFSNLVLIPEDKLNLTKPISEVGVDSMLAAEFRAWIFQAFKVDVPYLTLLSAAATLTLLSELITKKMMEAQDA
ncbi:ketoacyl-synt-domain-containing protein [Neurospora crassa]|uniref:Highly reducing polyketide synthase srdA n=1 Tax=Neurospora crassa (strain ATCC 24698 / 74-OR23-1A / CBS 708.71 / DSM 1257 / FGSC 987) TaxID=367110 RepID=SRDA_NEUCR|nr:polyketide synthase 6 [Neurospora crassa OR74A]Q7SHI6.1 RecName: Full=Highly reducing polyketide synthase srdA; Short=HRPKS sdrA; AltName: Full=Polyketide synthase gene cluster 6 protein pks-6; AltName: Full=Sordarial biosynthesis cluster protein srdA [Neurospora crassa OR74A]EAA36364.1 polyketide synthase 6 [Neurospora crassa OR74A]KHE89309.1 ketoacyl-synt-domain-containing protein [Neurospora crassa]|eukprot:XP_965600.1 polyketide synthase 6 [Neurospora crassa OR74A]